MTNHWIDYRNSDVFMNIGGNTAENHPISMKWIEKARETRGAKLIVVDPRITRTAAVADLYVPIRPGTNIAYLGGLINYVLENELYHKEYVLSYTNAAYLVSEEYDFDEETGLFSGIQDDPDRNAKKYDRSSWSYQTDSAGNPLKDPSLENPQCVFQLMKKFYAKYTLDTVSKITGCPKDILEESYRLYASTGKPGKAGNILYAMGITQFTHGSQNVRACAIVQLLLGNMGIPGGGVNAQRGQSNVQGSTDMATLYHIIPGYLSAPKAASHPTLADYIEKETPAPPCWWSNKPKYLISMLKAFWGEHATADNDFCYDYLPKLDHRDHSHIGLYKYMGEGEIKGLICWADNPAVTGPSAAAKRSYQSKLDWLVSVDIFENETASFWKKEAGANPKEIQTEVFLLPATASFEREGTKANSGRWIQWQWKAQDAPGECKADLQIAYELFKKLQELYAADPNATFPDPITKLKWDYEGEDGRVDIAKVCKEINGYTVADGQYVTNFVGLKDDGSTACGNWLFSGYYNNDENPACQSRIKETEGIGSNLGWSFAWPLNRRIVYNRCSADLQGNPWNPELQVFWWDEEGKLVKNLDIPDWPGAWSFEEAARFPYIMLPEGQARFFSNGMVDGPFPAHFEPAESPVPNLLYPKATFNPVSQRWYEGHLAETEEERSKYPYIMSTYRITEHYQSGIMTRNMPWLNETMPELFIEISEELAIELNIKNGETVLVESKRLLKNGEQKSIKAKACVTKRLKPMTVNGKQVHVVGMPFHWGYCGMRKGAITNDLSPSVGDANTTIPESKAFLCNIRKVG